MALSTLVVDLILKAGGFESDLGRASKSAQKRMKEIEASAKRMGAVLGTALVAAGTAAAYAVKSAIDRADEIHEASQKTGVAAETLSAYGYAARQAGVDFDSLTGSLGKLAKYQVEAATGNKEALQTFQAFGVELKDAQGNLRGVGEVFKDWSQVFSEMEDGPAKAALAMRIFGKSGADLIPMMDEGAAGLQEMTERARELGIVIDGETAARADAFNDKVGDLQIAIEGLATAVAAELHPDLTELADEFVNTTTKGNELSTSAKEIASGFRLARDTAMALWDGVGLLVDRYSELVYTSQALAASTAGGALFQSLIGNANAAEQFMRLAQAARRSGDQNAAEFGSDIDGHPRQLRVTPVDEFDRNGRDVILAGEGFGKGSGGGAKKGLSEAEQAAKRLQQAYESLRDAQLEQIALFGQEGEAAKVRYEVEHGDLKSLTEEKKQELVLQAERLDAMAAEAKVKEELARIDEERREGLKDYFNDLDFEASLIGKSNAERAAENELRRIGIDLTTKEGQALKDAAVARYEAMEAAADQVEMADRFRDHWEDAFADILTGTKSVGEAFRDLANSIVADIARMLAKQWVEKLFGQSGTTGGGSAGGVLSWFSSLFGSANGNVFEHGDAITAFANGGIVNGPTLFPMARGMGLMGEAGPEAVVPLQRMANGKLGIQSSGEGFHQENHFHYREPYDARTTQQTAARAGFEARRAFARNRR